MRTVKIIGGLGNQMFQYALLLGLQETFGEKMSADISGFQDYHLHNGLELESIFGIKLNVRNRSPFLAKKLTLSRYINQYLPFLCGKCQFEYPDFRYVGGIYDKSSKKDYYAGYWHHYKYVKPFRKEILDTFWFSEPHDEKNRTAIVSIKNENSIGIHVRRGDYLKEAQYQGICSLDYYTRGIGLIRENLKNTTFYVFSNDMQWCQDNMTPLFGNDKVVYVDWNKGHDSFRDMQLMTFCKGLIIANSSFSWWGAFLNQRQGNLIIAPKQWKNAKYDLKIQMPEWIQI